MWKKVESNKVVKHWKSRKGYATKKGLNAMTPTQKKDLQPELG